jgi:hypothetical protein
VKRRQCPDSEVRIIARQPGLRTIAVSSGLVNSAWAADEEDFERHFGIEKGHWQFIVSSVALVQKSA